jgi:hypothetical protein
VKAYGALSGVFDDGRTGRGQPAEGWEALSGKFAFVAQMLHVLWTRTRDKIVIVSNYTQTLDLMTILCRAKNYPCVRLDGSTSIKNRQKMVRFCSHESLVECCCPCGIPLRPSYGLPDCHLLRVVQCMLL